MAPWAFCAIASLSQAESLELEAGDPRSIGETVLDWALALLPSFVVLLVLVGVLALLNRVLARVTPADRSAGFRRHLVMLAVTAIGGLIALLALPLSDATLGGLLSLIGLVVSAAIALSATTFIANAMAGVMIRAVRNFRVGDFLSVGDFFGRVTERELVHTEIQTEDRDLLTLPNLYLVTNPVKVIRSSGTIVSATVSLGYDVPRDRVEELLVAAAAAAGLEEPFAQILALHDHAVEYRAAGLLRDVKVVLSTRSRLRAEMLDALHTGGVEVVSPGFIRQLVQPLAESSPVIPVAARMVAGDAGAAAEDLAFDKAEEGEGLASLRTRYSEIETALEALDEGDPGAAALSAQLEDVRRQIEAATARLEKKHT
jgi:small-conductance mechanosensitive channel